MKIPSILSSLCFTKLVLKPRMLIFYPKSYLKLKYLYKWNDITYNCFYLNAKQAVYWTFL